MYNNIQRESPKGRTYGECLQAEIESIIMLDGTFFQSLQIINKPKPMRRDDAIAYYSEKLRKAWDSLGFNTAKKGPVMPIEILNKNLSNLLLNVDAGTAYEDFSRSIAEAINKNGCSLDDITSMGFEPIDNGKLEIYTFINGEKHSIIIPSGTWEIRKQ